MIRQATRGWSLALQLCLLVLPALSLPVSASAQIWLSREGRYRQPVRPGLPDSRGGFVFCRLWYDATRRMPSGLGWSTDYPAADGNLMTRLEELTPVHVERWPDGEPGIAAMRATDPDLMKCPFLFMADPGSVTFSEAEVQGLRRYLLKGGFLWADDLWTDRAWNYFATEMSRVLPEYSFQEIGPEHPLFSDLYRVDEIPQIPSFQYWRRSGGDTSEFGAETARPQILAIIDDQGRLLVIVSHNTDIADGWEREGDLPDFFYRFSPESYGVAIDILIWAMTH